MKRKPAENTKKNISPNILIIAVAVIIGVIVGLILMKYFFKGKDEPRTLPDIITTESSGSEVTLIQPEVPYPLTVDFGPVLLDAAKREKKLIIMTQKASVVYEATKDGLFNWDVFKQSKVFILHGIGTYTVDFAGITEEDFIVDNENKTIEIHIPEPEISVAFIPEETEFFNSSNGILRFGEMQLTAEMVTEMQVIGVEQLKAKFEADDESKELAKKFAALSVKEIYEPIVTNAVNVAKEEANDEYAIPVYYTINVIVD